MITNAGVAFTTVVTRDHLHFALALAASLAEHHPDTKLFVCIVDNNNSTPEPDRDNLSFLSPEQFRIPRWHRFAFKYSPFELSCALKPFLLQYCAHLGYSKLVYLDADIQVYSNLDRVFQLLDMHHVLLTPHVTQDIPEDGGTPTLAILRNAGIYNAGFLAVRASSVSARFLNWWKERCDKQCILDLRGGFHVDQAWLDFVPAMFEGVCIVKDAGLNVGFWNLPHRPIGVDLNGQYRIHDEPLAFFHFSGLDADRPSVLSKHQDRLDLRENAVVQQMVIDYVRRLDELGRKKYESCTYGLANLSDGTPIQRKWREAVRVEDSRLADIENPFDTTDKPNLRRLLSLAATDVLESRSDWHQRTAVGIGNLIEKVPVIGWIYKGMRVLCEK